MHQLKPAHQVKGRQRKGEGEDRGGGGEAEAKKQTDEEADYVLKGRM